MTITAQNKYGKGPAPEGAPPPSAPPGPPRRGSSPRRRRLLGRVWLALLVVELAFLGTVGGSVVSALTAPGTQSTAARIAEWARNNGMSPLVTLAEQLTYQAPKVGGGSGAEFAAAPPERTRPTACRCHVARGHHDTGPAVVARGGAVAGDRHGARFPGDGPHLSASRCHPHLLHCGGELVRSASGARAAASRRGAARGHRVDGAVLHPTWAPDRFARGVQLRFQAGRRTRRVLRGRPLRETVGGRWSVVVFHADGTMTVGQWGRDVTMSPKVAAVRQNLTLLVDHGQVVPSINADTQQTWGSTIGSKKYVWRSGIGVTASGALVSVIGPRLSAHTLADLLQRAGCVRGMQLDINPDWTSFIDYHPTADPTHLQAVNLLPTMTRSPTRYNTTSARDFVTLHAR